VRFGQCGILRKNEKKLLEMQIDFLEMVGKNMKERQGSYFTLSIRCIVIQSPQRELPNAHNSLELQ
jgi:hypothetical protein